MLNNSLSKLCVGVHPNQVLQCHGLTLVSKCQQSSTVVYKFNHMCVHVQKFFKSSITINASLKKFKKIFKVQFQSNKVEKISSSSQLGLKKFQKFSKFNSSKT